MAFETPTKTPIKTFSRLILPDEHQNSCVVCFERAKPGQRISLFNEYSKTTEAGDTLEAILHTQLYVDNTPTFSCIK